MAIQTRVIWPPNMDTTPIQNKGIQLISLQPEPLQVSFDPSTGETTINRFWVDIASATDWISFVEEYNPISATIIS